MPEWQQLLKKSYKYGGYKKLFNFIYWSHSKLKYFNFTNNVFGGIPDIIDKSQICKIVNICYTPNAIAGNDVSKYTFKISEIKKDLETIESAFSFNFGGADSFQHFMQDCLAIIAASRTFLIENPEVVVLLSPPNSSFNSRNQLLQKIGIYNKVIFTNFENVNISNLYFWNFSPFAAKYSMPEEWLNSLHNYFNSDEILKLSDLVVITREEKTRSFENENEVIENFSQLALELGLKLKVIKSRSAKLETYEKSLRQAAIIISMHGGANFNLIFANKESIFFEFVPTKDTNSTLHYISKLGIKYVPVPLEFSLTENKKINIEQNKLLQINEMVRRFFVTN